MSLQANWLIKVIHWQTHATEKSNADYFDIFDKYQTEIKERSEVVEIKGTWV